MNISSKSHVVLHVVIVINDQSLSVGCVDADVGELLNVIRICKNRVPMGALDRFLGKFCVVKFVDKLFAEHLHHVLLRVVGILLDDPVSIIELDSLVEVREVFIDLDLSCREAKSVPFQGFLEENLSKVHK